MRQAAGTDTKATTKTLHSRRSERKDNPSSHPLFNLSTDRNSDLFSLPTSMCIPYCCNVVSISHSSICAVVVSFFITDGPPYRALQRCLPSSGFGPYLTSPFFSALFSSCPVPFFATLYLDV